MKTFVSLTMMAIATIFAGCVIAPVPLREKEIEDRWSGQGLDGESIVIRAEVKTWYLPIVASPEGPAKHRAEKSQRTFYVIDAAYQWQEDGPKSRPLPWLDLEASFTDSWQMIIRPRGVAYWIAFRVVDFNGEAERNKNRGVKQRSYEIAVFDLHHLISKRIVTTLYWPGPYETEQVYLAAWRYEARSNSITFQAPDGWKRYRLLEGLEEPNQAPEPTR